MIVYAESSAVLAWLLGESSGSETRRFLAGADRVVSSAVTGLECARGLARARSAGRIGQTEELAALQLLDQAEAGWDIHEVGEPVLTRARARFPAEPVRSLDALHLATAGLFHEALGGIALLSLDERIRANGAALGYEVIPSDSRPG
jgi:predicted nucleic acid-binding protein